MLKNAQHELVICLYDNIDGLPETPELGVIKEKINTIKYTNYGNNWDALIRDQDSIYILINQEWAKAVYNKTMFATS